MKVHSPLKNKRILVVDDEEDVLLTAKDLLDESIVDTARDFEGALEKIRKNKYDLALLDIMGVDGLTLLERTVEKKILTIMITAHALSPETLMESIRKGAISYLPKEELANLVPLLTEFLSKYEKGVPLWKMTLDILGPLFEKRFGHGWMEQNKEFWSWFSRTQLIGEGIKTRLRADEKIRSKGI